MDKLENQNKDITQRLANLRREIDQLDDHLWFDMQKRYKLVEEIINFKKELNLPMTDLERETEILQRIKQKFPELDAQFVSQVYQLIFERSKELFSKK